MEKLRIKAHAYRSNYDFSREKLKYADTGVEQDRDIRSVSTEQRDIPLQGIESDFHWDAEKH